MNIARVGISNRSGSLNPPQPKDPLHHVPDDGAASVRQAAIAKAEASASPEFIRRAREAAITQAEASVSLATPLNIRLRQAVRF